jgi:hypothetical protein
MANLITLASFLTFPVNRIFCATAILSRHAEIVVQSVNDKVRSFGKLSGNNGVTITDRRAFVPGAS